MSKNTHLSFDHIRIRQIRETRNLSQTALAQHLGISQSSYNDIEQGRTKLKAETLPLLAQSLRVEIKDFFAAARFVANGDTCNCNPEKTLEELNKSLQEQNEKLTTTIREQKITYEDFIQKSDRYVEDMNKRLKTKRFLIKILLSINVSTLCLLIALVLIFYLYE